MFISQWYHQLAYYQRNNCILVDYPLFFLISKLVLSFLPTFIHFHLKIKPPIVLKGKILFHFYTKILFIIYTISFSFFAKFFHFLIIFLFPRPSTKHLQITFCLCWIDEQLWSLTVLICSAIVPLKYNQIQMSRMVLMVDNHSHLS